MSVQLIAVLAFALMVLLAREAHVRQEQKRLIAENDELLEDVEVALLEDWFSLDWEDTR